MLKIAITGPESSGKTSLAKTLGYHYKVDWINEYARSYLEQKKGNYNQTDLNYIAKEQFEAFSAVSKTQNILITDTELLVIKIWSLVKYGKVSPTITHYFAKQNFDIYLLCKPDIPWEYDALREHPEMRDELFQMYKKELDNNHLPYFIVNGTEKERFLSTKTLIDQLIEERKHKK